MKIIYTILISFLCLINISAQDVFGTWKTIDDEDGKEKSHVEIYEENGKVYGKVIKLLEGATATHCNSCKGDLQGEPITDMVILYDLEKDGNEYGDGEILDPGTGKTYSCTIKLEEADKLYVRGYIGFSLLGRTQYWYRVK